MKTESLIDMLARGAGPAPRAVAARRLLPAAAIGLLCSGLLAFCLIGPVPAAMLAQPAFWIKLAYAAALAAAAGWLAARLARPIARIGGPGRALILVVGVMAVLGAGALVSAPAGTRLSTMLGVTWLVCPWYVLGLSLPALAGILWALRGLAPTRPRYAGFAAGLCAGALGAAGYSFSCLEVSPAFVSLWYTLGIGLAALVGSALGPRFLRW
jgi:hypothetical protein